jgi:hypothetical protein
MAASGIQPEPPHTNVWETKDSVQRQPFELAHLKMVALYLLLENRNFLIAFCTTIKFWLCQASVSVQGIF